MTDHTIDIEELISARAVAAKIIVADPVMAPAFDALDKGVVAREATDPVERARAVAARDQQREEGTW